MNLAQVVWYSLAIGFIVFISLLSVSYLSYRIKQSRIKIRANFRSEEKRRSIPTTNNRNVRFIPQKVAYVKKHSEIKETFSYSARALEEKRRREIDLSRKTRAFKSERTSGRFTVVNDFLVPSEREFSYTPSQIRRERESFALRTSSTFN